MRGDDGTPLIEWEHAKLMSAEQIVSLFQFDHYPIRHEAGGPTEPWNLQPRLIMAHRVKTATIDVPEIAKIKRVTKAQEEFRARLLAKSFAEDFPNTWGGKPKTKWPSRPMGKRK
jgi:hypothetical protein